MGSRMKIVLILLVIGITGTIFVFHKRSEASRPVENFLHSEVETDGFENLTDMTETKEKSEADEKKEAKIFVHVCGAVKKEGVYELKEGSRVIDALTMAGGLKKDADKRLINQAELLTDGIQIYVPSKNETKEEGKESGGDLRGIKKININTATKEELMSLPGIGESRAVSIIKYREENGRFKESEEIKMINGIKDSLFLKIQDQIIAK